MDTRMLALLLFCLCSQGLSDDGLFENGTGSSGKIPLVPLIPLMPSLPIGDPLSPTSNGSVPLESSEEEEDLKDCGGLASSVSAKRAVGGAIMKLGLELLKTLKDSPEQPNTIISPLSISLALSQLALGAVNETEQLLLHALHADALPCYHKVLRGLLKQLHGGALQVATRLYLKPGFKVKEAFAKESLHMYKSDTMALAGLEEVNKWVEKATKGVITNFLSSVPADLVLMLINAVHFKGQWQARFDTRFTSKDLFYLNDKEVVHVDMMLGPKYPLSLLIDVDLDAMVALFPFKQGMSLLVVMPSSGQVNMSAIGAKLNTTDLYARLGRPKTMQVKLPKFTLEYGSELKEAFTSMGLGELFSRPNLAKIADGSLLVSSVQHKSSMELNEEGAEATAATSVTLSRSNPTFSVNQPFFFALMDDKTQTPLFLGVVRNPNPAAPVIQIGGSGNNDKLPDKTNGHSVNQLPK
ncbi:alpha-2-antiplasmin-like [Anguilla rostrata]|uniref:alpha-2-antiplasmin-like n=1 Tax=Anguilla rostrata TaxID=7938 RepID=UPI0030CF0F51